MKKLLMLLLVLLSSLILEVYAIGTVPIGGACNYDVECDMDLTDDGQIAPCIGYHVSCTSNICQYTCPGDETEHPDEPEPAEKPESECVTDYDCNEGKHEKCNKDGTEENYFCIENYDTGVSNCELIVMRSPWCSMKICELDDDCYITTAVTPESLIDFETYDCCNNTLDSFNRNSQEFFDRKLKYYFRDDCPKKQIECKEQQDLTKYKAVCEKNACKITISEVIPVTESPTEGLESIEEQTITAKPEPIEEEQKITEEPKDTEKETPVAEKTIEEKKPYTPITKRIFEWVLSWFRR